MAGRILPPFSLILPIWLVRTMTGWKGTFEVLPALLVAGGSFAGDAVLLVEPRRDRAGRRHRGARLARRHRAVPQGVAARARPARGGARGRLRRRGGSRGSAQRTAAHRRPDRQGLVAVHRGLGVHLRDRRAGLERLPEVAGPERAAAGAAQPGAEGPAGGAEADARSRGARPQRRLAARHGGGGGDLPRRALPRHAVRTHGPGVRRHDAPAGAVADRDLRAWSRSPTSPSTPAWTPSSA